VRVATPPMPTLTAVDEVRATKLTLVSVFLALLSTFAARLIPTNRDLTPRPYDLLMLGLASFRIGRMLAYEGVAEPLREAFTRTRVDDTGAGQTVVATGEGARFVMGQLMSCPICIGTWVAAGLVYGLQLMPRPTRLLLAIMSTVGVAQLCHSATEWLDWNARAARRRCSD
jgi:Protein of unknown function (DUF1360)